LIWFVVDRLYLIEELKTCSQLFSLHWFSKIFLSIWFGGILAAGVLAVSIGFIERALEQLAPFLFAVLTIGFAGLLLVFLGNWISRDSI